jgi:large subunit ribosomal protein L22e
MIDCAGPVNDSIFDLAAYEKYLHDRIKVGGRTSNLSGSVTISKGSNSTINITVAPGVPFAKRYIKYLTKKFLKKNMLRDWLRVIATSKSNYQLKYFNIAADEAEDDDE